MSFFAGFVQGVFQGKDWREARDDRKRRREFEDEDREWTGEARGRQRDVWSQQDEDRARRNQQTDEDRRVARTERERQESTQRRVRESLSRSIGVTNDSETAQPPAPEHSMSVMDAMQQDGAEPPQDARAEPTATSQNRNERGALSVMPGLGEVGVSSSGRGMSEPVPQEGVRPSRVPLSMGEAVPQQQAAMQSRQQAPVQVAEPDPADVQRGAEIAGVNPYISGQDRPAPQQEPPARPTQRGYSLNDLVANQAQASTAPDDRPGMTQGQPYTAAELPPREQQSTSSAAPSRSPAQQAEQRERAPGAYTFNLGGAEMNISNARRVLAGNVAETAAEITGAFGADNGSLEAIGEAIADKPSLSAAAALNGDKSPSNAEIREITSQAQLAFNRTEIERHARVLEEEGLFQEARDWREYAKGRNVETAVAKLTEAATYWQVQDRAKALQSMVDLYNLPGYYEDGLTALSEGTSFSYDDQGSINGLTVTFRDEATGNVLRQSISGPGDKVFAMLIGALTPEATFEAGMKAVGSGFQGQQQGVPREDISILSTFIDEEGFERGRTRDGRVVPLVDENGQPVQRAESNRARSRTSETQAGSTDTQEPAAEADQPETGEVPAGDADLSPAPRAVEDRVTGQRYLTNDGRVVIWNGENWELAQ